MKHSELHREGDAQLLIYTAVQNKVVGKNKTIHIYTNGSLSWDVQRVTKPVQHVQTFSVLHVLLGQEFCNDTLQLSLGFALGEVPHLVVLRGDSHQPGTGKYVNISHCGFLFHIRRIWRWREEAEECRSSVCKQAWHFKWATGRLLTCQVNVGHETLRGASAATLVYFISGHFQRLKRFSTFPLKTSWTETKKLFHQSQKSKSPVRDTFQ